MKTKINFIKNYYKNTHSEKDFEDLLTFSEEEINEIYNEIIEMSKQFLQSKHDLNWIIYKNIKHTHMKFTQTELTILTQALQDYANSDNDPTAIDQCWGILSKIDKMINNFN